MSEQTLSIVIAHKTFQWLRENKYKLCVYRQSSKEYVKYFDSTDFIERPTFRWVEEIQVFRTTSSSGDTNPKEECVPVLAAYGQTVTVNPDGNMGGPLDEPDKSGKFSIINNYNKFVNIGIKTKINGKKDADVYVLPRKVAMDRPFEYTPPSTIKVWFESDDRAERKVPKSENGAKSLVPESKDGAERSIPEVMGDVLEVTYKGVMKHEVTYSGVKEGEERWKLSK